MYRIVLYCIVLYCIVLYCIVLPSIQQIFHHLVFQIFAFVSLVVIVLSVTTFCMESMEYFGKHKEVFKGLEYFYCVVFSLDLFARAICCPDKFTFIKSFMTWVDLLSVIPLYISITNASDDEDINFLFVLRLFRIFRLFRFFRTMSGMQVIGHTLRASARELFLLVLILTIPMVIFSTVVFYAEKVSIREIALKFLLLQYSRL